jgi:methylglutaconyl-CoA hydratase
MREAARLAEMLRALDDLPKPLIGRVQGAAYGGGVGLMAVCDVVIAAREARFSLTEVRLGLIPATIGPYVVRRIGEGASRRLFFNPKTFGVEEAQAFQLVSVVTDASGLDAAVESEVKSFLTGAPGAIAEAKALCKELARAGASDPMKLTMERLAERWESEEARAGIAAFFERRKPPWSGG